MSIKASLLSERHHRILLVLFQHQKQRKQKEEGGSVCSWNLKTLFTIMYFIGLTLPLLAKPFFGLIHRTTLYILSRWDWYDSTKMVEIIIAIFGMWVMYQWSVAQKTKGAVFISNNLTSVEFYDSSSGQWASFPDMIIWRGVGGAMQCSSTTVNWRSLMESRLTVGWWETRRSLTGNGGLTQEATWGSQGRVSHWSRC